MIERRLRVLAVVWFAAWVIVLAGVTLASVQYEAKFKFVDLPWAGSLLFDACRGTLAGPGVAVAAAALALGLVPLRAVPDAAALRRWFILGLVQSIVFGVFAWASFEQPLNWCPQLGPPPTAWREDDEQRRWILILLLRVAYPLVLLLAVAQAQAWASLGREACRLPRGETSAEASRAVVIALLPAVALASVAALVVAELGVAPPAWALVEAPVAAAGTTLLVSYAAVLAWRLRRA